METIIRYPDGQRVEAVVLSIGEYTMRVVPRDSADTMELERVYGQWMDESGECIEFESFVADDPFEAIHRLRKKTGSAAEGVA